MLLLAHGSRRRVQIAVPVDVTAMLRVSSLNSAVDHSTPYRHGFRQRIWYAFARSRRIYKDDPSVDFSI